MRITSCNKIVYDTSLVTPTGTQFSVRVFNIWLRLKYLLGVHCVRLLKSDRVVKWVVYRAGVTFGLFQNSVWVHVLPGDHHHVFNRCSLGLYLRLALRL